MNRAVQIEFECLVCGRTAVADVADADVETADRPLETLRRCPRCNVETIWTESSWP